MNDTKNLILQCQLGDKCSFGKLVAPILKKAYSISYSILKSKEWAEDAVQNSLLESYQNIMSGKEFYSFENWFFRLVASRSLDLIRKNSKEKQSTYYDETLEIESSNDLPIDIMLKKEEKQGLLEKIMDLPDKLRILTILYYYQDFSIKEISTMLNIREGTIKTNLCRARKKLESNMDNKIIPLRLVK